MANDGDLPGAVVRALHALADDQPALGLAPDRIFFDRDHLLAGDYWDDKIESAIREADVFLLLVSLNAVTSDYCMKRELQLAAELGMLIVPVLLSDCTWSGHRVNGDPQGRLLGLFGAVPKDDNGNHLPIKSKQWGDRDTALTRMAQQIALRLAHDDAQADTSADTSADGRLPPQTNPHANPPNDIAAVWPAIASPAGRPASTPMAGTARCLAPYTPYLCNQAFAAGAFNSGIFNWAPNKLLLVIVKGTWADHPEGFWERMCAKNLHDFCAAQQLPVLPPRRLKLPPAMDGSRLRPALAADLRGDLSEALFGNMFKLRSGNDMGELLSSQQAVLPLFATLPIQADDANIALLRALLDLLEDAPLRAPLDRLVLAVQVADPVLMVDPALRKRLKLERRRRTLVLELDALAPVSPEDVRQWHEALELSRYVSQPWLLDTLFAKEPALRMRAFDETVRPLIGLGAFTRTPP